VPLFKKYRVYGVVTGGKYIGEFRAESMEKAIEAAGNSDNAYVSLCHQCSDECEDPEIHKFTAEEAT
jgi:hypothetical protein